MNAQQNIAIIIPMYNEEKTILSVINKIHKSLKESIIYVFDNNSTDNSALLVKNKIKEITLESRSTPPHLRRS